MGRRTNANTLKAYWSKKEKSLVFYHPDFSHNGHLLYNVLAGPRPYQDLTGPTPRIEYDNSFVEELQERGYDLTTLRFSICKKEPPPVVTALRLAAEQIKDGAHVGAAKNGGG